jgi:hypothetical protein
VLGHDEPGPIVGRVRLRTFILLVDSRRLPVFAFEAEAADLLAPELGLGATDALPADGGPLLDNLRLEVGEEDFAVVLGSAEWIERHRVRAENAPWLAMARSEGRALFLLGPRGFARDDGAIQEAVVSGTAWGGLVPVVARP